jgi:DNA-binding transcriptional LysR family regulator
MAADRPPLAGLDLNLLVTLRALLRESSVTRAAIRLGHTQPTVSRALATLRTSFHDPLLVRTGRQMSPTPFAAALLPELERALGSLDRLPGVGMFEPHTSERTFRLVLPDLLGLLLVGGLARRLAADGPRLSMQILGHEQDALPALLEDRVDLVVAAPVIDHPELFSRRIHASGMTWSVLYGSRHPAASRGLDLDLDLWASSKHVVLAPGGRPDSQGVLDRVLNEAGVTRSVRLHVSHLSGLGATIAATDWVATLPTPVAREVARQVGIQVAPHPLSDHLPVLPIRLTWHAIHQSERGHVWLREVVTEVVEDALRG